MAAAGEARRALRRLHEAKLTIAESVKRFTCTLGQAMKLDAGRHDARLDHQPQRHQHGRLRAQVLEKNFVGRGLAAALAHRRTAGPALHAAGARRAPPWGKAATLGERMMLEKTGVCTDGKSHYVVVAPHDKQGTQLYYGDGKTFYRVPCRPGC